MDIPVCYLASVLRRLCWKRWQRIRQRWAGDCRVLIKYDYSVPLHAKVASTENMCEYTLKVEGFPFDELNWLDGVTRVRNNEGLKPGVRSRDEAVPTPTPGS